jgi:hypothetical protein
MAASRYRFVLIFVSNNGDDLIVAAVVVARGVERE